MPHLIEEPTDLGDPAFLYLNLHPGEEIKFIVRHHWAGFLPTLMLVLGMGLFPVLVILLTYYLLNQQFLNPQYLPIIVMVLSAYFIFLLTFLFGNFINYYFDIIFITNQRILNINQEGLLARKASELSHNQIQNVAAEVHGFLPTLFNYGHLVIETAGQGTSDDPTRPGLQGYFTIHDLPDPNRLARIILELHRTTP